MLAISLTPSRAKNDFQIQILQQRDKISEAQPSAAPDHFRQKRFINAGVLRDAIAGLPTPLDCIPDCIV
jgi:hypothetical protein